MADRVASLVGSTFWPPVNGLKVLQRGDGDGREREREMGSIGGQRVCSCVSKTSSSQNHLAQSAPRCT